MADVLTPVRIGRAHNASVSAGATETQELDFDFSLRQGALIHAVEFAVLNVVIASPSNNDNETAVLSLHVETGALEDTLDGATDEFRLDSEVVAEAALMVTALATSGIAAMVWTGERRWDYNAILGKPLLIAQNMTFRVDATAGLVINGATARILYQYVRLTPQELADQFLLRR